VSKSSRVDYVDKFAESLMTKDSSEIERDLAQYYFDLLFIQTQIEVSRAEDSDAKSIIQNGEKRLSRLQMKIEAMKKELLNRKNSTVQQKEGS
jgi:hypothetical protein